MPKTWSAATRDAAQTLGADIARHRRERRMTAAELAERAGVSLVTLRKVERGDPTVAIGTVFEVAVLVGVRLFNVERADLPVVRARALDRLALLPAHVYPSRHAPDDDF